MGFWLSVPSAFENTVIHIPRTSFLSKLLFIVAQKTSCDGRWEEMDGLLDPERDPLKLINDLQYERGRSLLTAEHFSTLMDILVWRSLVLEQWVWTFSRLEAPVIRLSAPTGKCQLLVFPWFFFWLQKNMRAILPWWSVRRPAESPAVKLNGYKLFDSHIGKTRNLLKKFSGLWFRPVSSTIILDTY